MTRAADATGTRGADGSGPPALVLQRASAAEQVADRLTALILEGTIGPGERLRESTLAQTLDISRNSVREGIRLLERGRLVKYEMHRGAVVVTPSIEELDDLYRTRLHLESLGVGVEATPAHTAALERAFEHLVDAADTGSARAVVAADLAFHSTLVARLGSARIDSFFETVMTETGYYLLILSHADDEIGRIDEAVLDDHRLLLEAVRSGDAGEARRALTAHLRSNHERIRQILAGGDTADAR
ncbi:GntR family transcriptional regulator [Leucobacter tenebrionis]|uniref:GntR family transcriptional regulator n=1 Tax=Leucobacter tenebrionis TaxID=2873270 RepID=UPI001CA60B29|nr:GntR family transcriptional regulator [Leucobacter tenebrionis]QZY50751.1 GntR family transcriptional regulator [Leucobacter tenebrionis]